MSQEPIEFLTVKEVAEVLRVTGAYVYKLMADHRIQSFAFGGTYRISRAAVNEFIQQSERPRASSPAAVVPIVHEPTSSSVETPSTPVKRRGRPRKNPHLG